MRPVLRCSKRRNDWFARESANPNISTGEPVMTTASCSLALLPLTGHEEGGDGQVSQRPTARRGCFRSLC